MDFHERVEAFLNDHPELGYQTTAELVRDLLRRWLEQQKAAEQARQGALAHRADERDAASVSR